MRISELIEKNLEIDNTDPYDKGKKFGQKLLSPLSWINTDSDKEKVDPNLIQNPAAFMSSGQNSLDLVIRGKALYSADKTFIQRVLDQITSGQMKPSNDIDAKALVSGLRAALSGRAANPQQIEAIKQFHKQFR